MGNKSLFNNLLIILIFIISSHSFAVYSQVDSLVLVKDKDGIQIYKEKDAHLNINRIVSRSDYSSNFMDILALVRNFEHQKDWVYSNTGAVLIDSISPYEWIYYSISETPWPFQDRDIVARVKLEVDYEAQCLTIHSVAEPNLIPISPEIVRIMMMDSKWRITKISEKSSRVELDMLIDVGGNVPQWLVNLFAAKGPFTTFSNMREELKDLKHQSKVSGYEELIIFEN